MSGRSHVFILKIHNVLPREILSVIVRFLRLIELTHHRSVSLGWVSTMDSDGRTIWIVDAHRDDGERFVVRADEKLTAFVELESAIRATK